MPFLPRPSRPTQKADEYSYIHITNHLPYTVQNKITNRSFISHCYQFYGAEYIRYIDDLVFDRISIGLPKFVGDQTKNFISNNSMKFGLLTDAKGTTSLSVTIDNTSQGKITHGTVTPISVKSGEGVCLGVTSGPNHLDQINNQMPKIQIWIRYKKQ